MCGNDVPTMAVMTANEARRYKVLCAWEKNKSQKVKTLANSISLPEKFVRRWVARFNSGNTDISDAPRSGRKPELSKKDVAAVRRHLGGRTTNNLTTATESLNRNRAEDEQVCRRTVKRALEREYPGKLEHGPVKRSKVSEDNAAKRQAATTRAAINRARRELYFYILLDGAIVSWKPREYIKAFRVQNGWNDADRPRKINTSGWKQYQYYAAVAVTADGVVHRHSTIPVPGKTPTAEFFIEHVAKPLLAWARKVVGDKCKFVQDNASAHTAKVTKQWMKDVGFILVKHPAQSPDLNRIEPDWRTHKRGCETRRPQSEAGLWQAVEEEWQKVPDHEIANNIYALPDVMKQVNQSPGRLVNHCK